MLVPRVERILGIEVYATRSLGIGGLIRQGVEDFVVEEILVDGSKAQVNKLNGDAGKSVLGSSAIENRYLLCVLVKRNWDMFIALANIAHQLGISPTQIQIAGIKDAKAITAQHITIEDVSMKEVQNLALKDMEVRPMGYLRTELSSYYLLGNNFHIAINEIRHSETTIGRRFTKIVEEIDTLGGIPNFFGHQRFGTARPITHLVGKAIVKGSLEQAAMLFLAKPSPYEHPMSREARRELRRTRDFKKALGGFPKQLRYERLMLESLAEKPNDFAAAFKRLPARLRELFVQAYQSYLFNRFLSGRIKKGLSLNVADVGDYVVSVERSGLPMLAMWKVVNRENLAEINKAIRDGRMRLAIPLIGYRQHMSEGVQGDIEHEVLQEEGISPQDFRVGVLPEISSKGELRGIIAPVKGLAYNYVSTGDAESLGSGVNLDFMLFRGSYATVVLREFMKVRKPIEAGF